MLLNLCIGSSSSHSQVLNQRLNTKNKKESRKFPLQNKYIGVRRLEFEDDTDGKKRKYLSIKSFIWYVHYFNVTCCISGHSIELNNLDDFKSTLYSCSEKEGIYLVSSSQVFLLIFIYIHILLKTYLFNASFFITCRFCKFWPARIYM
jgi:hypothetical protein